MACLHPFYLKSQKIYVPCGKCLACKRKLAFENSMRCMFELQSNPDAVFLTLTFDDEHLPHSISVRDLQLFFKRLRKAVSPRKIRYFACGEYGDKSERPHYHAIVFGLSLTKDSNCARCSHRDDKPCNVFCRSWTSGNVYLGNVTPASCRYVASYVQKKYFGDVKNKVYIEQGLKPPFQVQSRGLGFDYFVKSLDRICKYGFTYSGQSVGVPRAFVQKIRRDFEKRGELSDKDVDFLLFLSRAARASGHLLPPSDSYLDDFYTKYRDLLAKSGFVHPSPQLRVETENALFGENWKEAKDKLDTFV